MWNPAHCRALARAEPCGAGKKKALINIRWCMLAPDKEGVLTSRSDQKAISQKTEMSSNRGHSDNTNRVYLKVAVGEERKLFSDCTLLSYA